MRKVFVGYASNRGATAEIAETIAQTLRAKGFAVDVHDLRRAPGVVRYDAVVLGSAIYAGRWMRHAVRFLKRHKRELRQRPVWLFHDGPLTDELKDVEQPLPGKIHRLARQIAVLGTATFGGRLDPQAKGLVASKMARRYGGDYRDFEAIGAWATEIADQLTPKAA